MKRLLALIAAGFVLPTGIAGANLINEGRNIAALNANNLVQTNYTLPTARNNVTEYSFELKGCLLYTSPSPRDLSTSRMPSSA